MRAVAVSLVLLAILAPRPAGAQDPPPRIGPFVLDLHATKPRFPNDPLLAASRGLALALLGRPQEAAVEFETFLARLEVNNPAAHAQYAPSRREWVAALKRGGDPFDEATLEQLLQE